MRDLDVLQEQSVEHKAALIFFLIGAVQENLMLNGRSARSALEAARIALGWTPDQLAEVTRSEADDR